MSRQTDEEDETVSHLRGFLFFLTMFVVVVVVAVVVWARSRPKKKLEDFNTEKVIT